MAFLPFLHDVARGVHLTRESAYEAMSEMLTGEATTAQIAAFLVALKMKGETPEELVGFASAMRALAEPVHVRADGTPLIDTCGTGGDALGTFNISTIAAFVVAGAGVRVAKHGNRSISGRCGSADVLERLGVAVPMAAERTAAAIDEVGVGFLFAPAHHPAARYVQPARVELKMRTVFNLLGPLTNPAGAPRQLIGAPSAEAAELMAHALAHLGTEKAFVVHGYDGLDEVSTTAPTLVFEIVGSAVKRRAWTPDDFGVPQAELGDLVGGGPEENAAIVREVLLGGKGPRRDIVLVNTAAALVAAGRAANEREGMRTAAHSLDSGAARGKLEQLVEWSKRG